MTVTLYYGSGSPYAWRVWLALEHKQIPYDFKLLSFDAGDTRSPDFLKLNPRGKVPVLTDGDMVVTESIPILEYIAERFPAGPTLYAPDLRTRTTQRRMIRETDIYVKAVADAVVEPLMRAQKTGGVDAEALAKAVAAAQAEFANWEAQIGGDWLAGDLSAADFTLYPFAAMIGRIETRRPGTIPAGFFTPKLAAWVDRMAALPIVQKTLPPHWKG
jgi:glutathione S-transferase